MSHPDQPTFNSAIQQDYLEISNILKSGNTRDVEAKISAMPNFKGEGTNGFAFSYNINGENYIAKFPKYFSKESFNSEVAILNKVKGLDNVVQIVTSFEDTGIIITKELPGQALDRFKFNEVPVYTDEQIKQVCSTVIEIHNFGLTVDPKHGNFILNPNTGSISILDLLNQSRNHNLFMLFYPLSNTLGNDQEKWESSMTQEQIQNEALERYKRGMLMCLRILRCLKINFKDAFDSIYADNKTTANLFKEPYKFVQRIPEYEKDLASDKEFQIIIEGLKQLDFIEN